MGGLFVIVMLPMLLPIAFLYFLGMALPFIMRVLLVLNVLLLAGLLLICYLWKKSGTMDRAFIDRYSGWKWWLLILLRYGLILSVVWEILLVLLCGACILWWPELLEALLVL